jgi:hypothetical protein
MRKIGVCDVLYLMLAASYSEGGSACSVTCGDGLGEDKENSLMRNAYLRTIEITLNLEIFLEVGSWRWVFFFFLVV